MFAGHCESQPQREHVACVASLLPADCRKPAQGIHPFHPWEHLFCATFPFTSSPGLYARITAACTRSLPQLLLVSLDYVTLLSQSVVPTTLPSRRIRVPLRHFLDALEHSPLSMTAISIFGAAVTTGKWPSGRGRLTCPVKSGSGEVATFHLMFKSQHPGRWVDCVHGGGRLTDEGTPSRQWSGNPHPHWNGTLP